MEERESVQRRPRYLPQRQGGVRRRVSVVEAGGGRSVRGLVGLLLLGLGLQQGLEQVQQEGRRQGALEFTQAPLAVGTNTQTETSQDSNLKGNFYFWQVWYLNVFIFKRDKNNKKQTFFSPSSA